jgi:hypothetical protein
MTIVSGILLILEPMPTSGASVLSLQAVDEPGDKEDLLFATNSGVPLRRWTQVVIHASGTSYGSADTIGQVHHKLGRGGLGYHFVINNGAGQEDGMTEIGSRWRRQWAGAYRIDSPGAGLDDEGIGICLIGNGDKQPYTAAQIDQLTLLVRELQKRFQIPAYCVQVQTRGSHAVGRLFPQAQFHTQLLDRLDR